MSSQNKIYIIAGNYLEYVDYTASVINYQDTAYVYVERAENLRGLQNIHGKFIGTWKSREDITDIVHMITLINGKNPLVAKSDQRDMEEEITATKIPADIIKGLTAIPSSWTDLYPPVTNGGISTNTHGIFATDITAVTTSQTQPQMTLMGEIEELKKRITKLEQQNETLS
jgi:hypothetical protein